MKTSRPQKLWTWSAIHCQLIPELRVAIEARPNHVACPLKVGGKDGLACFRDYDSTGGMVCNTCGAFPNGYLVIAHYRDCTVTEARRLVKDLTNGRLPPLQNLRASPSVLPQVDKSAERRIERLLSESYPLDHRKSAFVRSYFVNRGLSPDEYPEDILGHPKLPYFGRDGSLVGYFPAMLSIIHKSRTVGLHATYLQRDGSKAAVESPKKILPPIYRGATSGGAVWLDDPIGDELSITEGIETGLAVREATGSEVWAAISTSGMRTIEIPRPVRRVVIWADNDECSAGEKAAISLKQRLVLEGRDVLIKMPRRPKNVKSYDWLDVFCEGES